MYFFTFKGIASIQSYLSQDLTDVTRVYAVVGLSSTMTPRNVDGSKRMASFSISPLAEHCLPVNSFRILCFSDHIAPFLLSPIPRTSSYALRTNRILNEHSTISQKNYHWMQNHHGINTHVLHQACLCKVSLKIIDP